MAPRPRASARGGMNLEREWLCGRAGDRSGHFRGVRRWHLGSYQGKLTLLVSYEARIGWRYLYGGKRDPLMLALAGGSVLITLIGLAILLTSDSGSTPGVLMFVLGHDLDGGVRPALGVLACSPACRCSASRSASPR